MTLNELEITFATPLDISQVDQAFPTSVRRHLPPFDSLPAEYQNWMRTDLPSFKLVSDIMFNGIVHGEWTPKPGVNAEKAYRHVMYCLRSWEPKHEHKVAGVAWLIDQWFAKVEYKVKERT